LKRCPAFFEPKPEEFIQGSIGDLEFAAVAARDDESVEVLGEVSSGGCTNRALHVPLNAPAPLEFHDWWWPRCTLRTATHRPLISLTAHRKLEHLAHAKRFLLCLIQRGNYGLHATLACNHARDSKEYGDGNEVDHPRRRSRGAGIGGPARAIGTTRHRHIKHR
jgi:hypothetical protein